MPTGPIRCEPALVAVEGFARTETSREVYADHVGVRLGFWDGKRQLHVLAGIPGEVGEGLPIVDVVAITGGPPGRLLGGDRVWVLAWETTGPCANNALLGDGFTREAFTAVLVRAGVIDAPDA
jgi:hypothetical protein